MNVSASVPQTLVCATGPESSGKSSLSLRLAHHLGGVWVPELARSLLPRMLVDGGYTINEVEAIARAQQAAEHSALAAGHRLVVADTDLTVIAVWCDVRFARIPQLVLDGLECAPARLSLLCAPDLPWQADDLRENPHDRDELFERYVALLNSLGWRYRTITSVGESRFQQALAYVHESAESAESAGSRR